MSARATSELKVRYECRTCDVLAGNTDPKTLHTHLLEENKGRRSTDQWRHEPRVVYPTEINCEISDLFAKGLSCPYCQSALTVIRENISSSTVDEAGEILNWEVRCPGCNAKGVVHND